VDAAAAAATPAIEPVDDLAGLGVWAVGGALDVIEKAIERFEAHRNEVSRAGHGNVGSQQGAQLNAHAAHITVAIRSLEDGVHRLRAVRDGNAGAAPQAARAVPAGAIPPQPVTVEGGAATPIAGGAHDEAFPVPVSADSDPFARQFLTCRPSTLIADLTRAAIERLGIEPITGTWALHLEGRPLSDAMTAADAGLRRGSELVLLNVG
jgi:hypothetical protein